MHNEERGRLDAAIDRAVRGMVQVDPRAGLRHRVAARLNTPEPRSWWTLPALATAALCVALLVFWMTARVDVPVPVAPGEIASNAAPPAAPQAAPQLVPPPVDAPAASRVTPAERPRRVPEPIFGQPRGRISAASIERPAPRIRTLPVEIASDEPAMGTAIGYPAAIVISPIVLEPIAITPLGISALPIRK
jgi:hypothetical protein